MPNWIDDLKGKDIASGGTVTTPRRSTLNFVGATATDNPATGQTDVTVDAGAGTPLYSSVRYVDADTTVDGADQNGSVGAPFAVIQDAIDALVAVDTHGVWVAPGNYAEDDITIDNDGFTTIINGPALYDVGDITITAGTLAVVSARVSGDTLADIDSTLTFRDCYLLGGDITGESVLTLQNCIAGGPASVAANTLDVSQSLLATVDTIGITGTSARFEDARLPALTDITFINGAGTVTMDGESFRSAADAGLVLTNGSITLTSEPAPLIASLSGASNTLTMAHAFKTCLVSHSSATTVTINSNANVKYPIGTVIGIRQDGAGQVTVAVTSDTLRLPPGITSLKTAGQYATIYIKKVAATEWTYTHGEHERPGITFGRWASLGASATTSDRWLQDGASLTNPTASERNGTVVADEAGTFTSFRIHHDVALSTDSVTYTVRINQANTAAAITVNSGATSGTWTGSVAYAAGDRISIKMVQSGTEASANMCPRATLTRRA